MPDDFQPNQPSQPDVDKPTNDQDGQGEFSSPPSQGMYSAPPTPTTPARDAQNINEIPSTQQPIRTETPMPVQAPGKKKSSKTQIIILAILVVIAIVAIIFAIRSLQ